MAAEGARVRFDTECLGHVQDDEGATTSVRDRLSGAEYTIRSKYVIGADGARSQFATHRDLPFEGPGAGPPPAGGPNGVQGSSAASCQGGVGGSDDAMSERADPAATPARSWSWGRRARRR
ncbi:FAD-dependent monooxygenase [Blastococcus brunescens]|uniref:FAD-dependent monooxygenase n=1 Tax=Blastococcus brunescens TaxID=1564165 RepID=A0ABZ1B7T5_9ACTN|nr:FAD-dependent monooxygenase [Blastococcus sp. BMG 8361]WRL66864.1 FAD-dependent monooxygenase [Blastococcus sp. BMG 8361]